MKTGDQLKLDGMESVLSHSSEDWHEIVDGVVKSLPIGALVTGETIRQRCRMEPDHPNAWGAIIHKYVRRGRLVPTGRYVKMQTPSSHSRVNPLYRVERPEHELLGNRSA